MPSQVLFIESGSLFDDAMKSLLRQQGELEVLTTDGRDNTTLAQEISHLSPEAILVNGDVSWDEIRFCELASILPTLAKLRVVVVVRPDDNVIEVYERQRIQASQVDDLIAVIKRGDERA